jgi:DNA polymerase-1
MHEKKLFLLDAFALIYRGYFALNANAKFNPVNSKGLDTSAILGFTNTLVEVLTKQKPTHIAVVFDTAAPTARHEDFTEYKANREEMPDAIAVAIPYIKEILAAFKIPVIESDGYEADDIIGTLAKKAEERGFITYMMTPDKDFAQLVTENIFIYKPGRFGSDAEILGVKEVCEKFEVTNPLQVIDILGLWGDAVDNIPGIPGIGEKTAKQLIKEFGSIENLLANTDKLKGKLKERVEENKEQALKSKKLASILTNAPVAFDEQALILEEPDKEKVLELFSELEFRTLAKRVLGQEIQSVNKSGQIDLFGNIEETPIPEKEIVAFKTIKDTPHKYILVQTLNEVELLCEELLKQKEISFDTETTSLEALDAELVGMSFSFKKSEAYYVSFPNNRTEAEKLLQPIKKVLENEEILKIGQNIKYDILILKNYGIEVKGVLFDTMLAHYLIEPEKKHGMDYLSETFLNYRPISIEELIGKKGKNQGNMRDVLIDIIKEYAAEDADITFQLKEKLSPQLSINNCEKLFYQIETPLVSVLAAMEFEGVNINVTFLKEYSIKLQEELLLLEKSIYELAGTTFNIDSPKQLGDILFEKLKIDEKAKKTKTGQYATGEDVLAKLSKKHPIIEQILDYRELRKLKSTYVDSLPEMVNKKTGRIHTTFMQAVAATGRLSSNNPNLQNIPIKTERGRMVRKAFVPRNADYLILSADYSQVELRIIAALSKDENMIAAFKEGKDIHAATAARVFGVELENVTKEMRSKAKAVNFGIIYGQSAFGLSENLGISRTEAKEIIDNYFKQYPRIKSYMDNNIQMAKEKGYVETIMGRRRYLNDINSSNATVRGYAERNAINAPIQGSAADIIKKAMIDIFTEIQNKKLKSKMILQVHDELVFDLYKPEKEELMQIVKQKMEGAYNLEVPLITEINTGENWLEAH